MDFDRLNPHVVAHASLVSPLHRAKLQGQTPVTVWFTGLSGAGKSTLANDLDEALIAEGHACFVLDGDNIRQGLNRNLGFSAADRAENIRRVAEVAKLMNDAGLIVLTAFISPYRDDRAVAKQIVGDDRFIEVHISTCIAVCEARDVKQLYRRARSGQIAEFTGISAPYEEPLTPHLRIDTAATSRFEVKELLLKLLEPFFNSNPH
jgi:adenylylsulfate kinase